MPPVIALLLTLGFILFLFRRESREKTQVSRALWIPLIWFLISGSRFVSQWLSLVGAPFGNASPEEGSPLDAAVFFFLIVAGLAVLNRRRVTLSEFARTNGWLVFFLLYCFLAIF